PLDDVAAAIAAGEVVAVPTDTVYGLVCDPSNSAAVERVYAIKQRPAGLELTLLAAAIADVESDVTLDATAHALAARFWPGPLSIVAPLRSRRLAIPRSGDTLSVRVPGHPLLLELLQRTGPLASTSANRHGEPPAADASAVVTALGASVAAVLDGGSAGGLASTIIDCSRTPPRVLRKGPIPEAELRALAAPDEASPRIQTTTRNDAG
ncbi:MAG TPA: L-threonylcarbamoyladenylate synthase, partial [Candidatus Dormibacteraeota bacterium]